MKGGRIVLPSEYFGTDSGAYHSSVNSTNTTVDIVGVSRAALAAYGQEFSKGGGTPPSQLIISTEVVKEIVEKYKKSSGKTFRISEKVLSIIASSVQDNITTLISECRKNTKTSVLSKKVLFTTLKKNFNLFAHLSYVWKSS